MTIQHYAAPLPLNPVLSPNGASRMRKIVVSEFLSADGVMEAPDTWQFPFQTEEMGAITERQIRDTDAFLLGRVTYEIFAGFWPTQTHNEFGIADKLNRAPKHVVSTTLQKADWNNSTQIMSNVIEEIRKLTQQPDSRIGISGSATLVHSLLDAGLIDEIQVLCTRLSWAKASACLSMAVIVRP